MKYSLKHTILAFLSIAIISSCSKDDDKEEVVPETPTIETNTAPDGNYFTGVSYENNKGYAAWTTDFVTFNKFTAEFQQVYNVKVENDTVLISYTDNNQANYIAYAPLSNLSGFKTITSAESITEFSILNGVIIVYAQDGLNKYTGYCNLNQGNTFVQYGSNLPVGTEFSGFKNTGTSIIANHQNNSTQKMAFTNDGVTWNILGSIDGGRFEVFDGKTWRFSSLNWEYTSDSDLSSATWTSVTIHSDSLNTTGTAGSFSGSYLDINSTSSWRYYGRIYNGTTAFPALNTSLDQGITWTTQLLPSIQSINDNSYLDGEYYTFNSLVILNKWHTNYQFPKGIYTATNGVDFMLDSSQTTKDRFNRIDKANYIR